MCRSLSLMIEGPRRKECIAPAFANYMTTARHKASPAGQLMLRTVSSPSYEASGCLTVYLQRIRPPRRGSIGSQAVNQSPRKLLSMLCSACMHVADAAGSWA